MLRTITRAYWKSLTIQLHQTKCPDRKIIKGRVLTPHFPYQFPLAFSWLPAGSLLHHTYAPAQISTLLGTKVLHSKRKCWGIFAPWHVMFCSFQLLAMHMKLLLRQRFRKQRIWAHFLALTLCDLMDKPYTCVSSREHSWDWLFSGVYHQQHTTEHIQTITLF